MLVDPIGDVRYVEASITFTREIKILRLEFAEDVQELREESGQLLGQLVIVRDIRRSLAKAGSDRLLHPQDMGEIRPRPLVGYWRRLSP